jgi:hypothetical protein
MIGEQDSARDLFVGASAEELCGLLVPLPQVLWSRETTSPESVVVGLSVRLVEKESALRVGFEVQCPTVTDKPLVQPHALSFNAADAYTSAPVGGVRTFVVTLHCPLADELVQLIARGDPARPCCSLVIKASLIQFGSVDAIEPIHLAIQCKGGCVFDS